MIHKNYKDIKPRHFETDAIKGVSGRVVIGNKTGANNFCMRVFEFSPDGYTPKHSHDWEHELFFHSGSGEVYGNGQWNPVQAGSVVFIPPNEEHQIRNSGQDLLVAVCLIPAGVPEL